LYDHKIALAVGSSQYLGQLGLLREDGGPVDAVETGCQDRDDKDVENQPHSVDPTFLLAAAVRDLLLDPLLLQIRLKNNKIKIQI